MVLQKMSKNGAELAFAYQNERLLKKIKPIADDLGVKTLIECDVACDKSIEQTFSQLKDEWGTLDGIVHSIGFAPSDQLDGDFTEVTTREGFQIAHDISSYSFTALAKGALPILSEKAALLTLTYLGLSNRFQTTMLWVLLKLALRLIQGFLLHHWEKRNQS